ncbi:MULTISPECIES: hypothetical protein [unclassified Nocardioides]|uniref:hypothetical protein n=1 Tax=unclassified Nocardioides TaxID=2615069 RepID=UPI0030144CB8
MPLPRRRTRVALLAAALTLLTAPVATAGSAHAGTWSHEDARGDVVRIGIADDKPTGEVDPDEATTDITKFTVKHAPRKVVITLKIRDLRSGDSALIGRIVTPRTAYDVSVFRTSDMRIFSLSEGRRATDVPCRGKKQSFDTKRDRVTLTFPRVCLGNPKWVRAGAGFLRGNLLSGDETTTVTLDEALRTGSEEAAASDAPLKVGKKVRVG